MTSILAPWLDEFAETFARQLASGGKTAAWEVSENRSPAGHWVHLPHGCYRIVDTETLAQGFSLALLGARYEWHCCNDSAWPQPLHEILQRERGKGRFYVLLLQAGGGRPAPCPLLTLLQDHRGDWHLLETTAAAAGSLWPLLTAAAHLLAERTDDPARYDDFGDFLELGAASVVQRHSTERLQKFIAQKVIYDPRLCTQCLRCATACNEMRAIVTDRGALMVGPSEDFCTNCGLCQKRCPFLQARPKEELAARPELSHRVTEGGAGVHLYGAAAAEYSSMLERCAENGDDGFPYAVHRQLEEPENFPESHDPCEMLATARFSG